MKSVRISYNLAKTLANITGFSLPVRQDGALLRSGAKLFHRANGWWYISGYACDGRDVDCYMKNRVGVAGIPKTPIIKKVAKQLGVKIKRIKMSK